MTKPLGVHRNVSVTIELPPEVDGLLKKWARRKLNSESGLIREFILRGLEQLCPGEVEAILSPKQTVHELNTSPVANASNPQLGRLSYNSRP